jgi:hypothetical protein
MINFEECIFEKSLEDPLFDHGEEHFFILSNVFFSVWLRESLMTMII